MRVCVSVALACLAALLAAVSSLASHQEPKPAATPEQVVDRYFERIKTSGFGAVADLMHPDELKKFREMMSPVIETALSSGDKTFAVFADQANPTQMRSMDDLSMMNVFLGWATAASPGMVEAMKSATMQTIGHVIEGDVKHVVVRSKVRIESVTIEKMSVISVKDYQGQPRLMLTGDMTGMVELIKRRR